MQTLNPSQKQAVEYIGGPLLIVAGAGTGKTTVITEKIAYLIGTHCKPEEILALTFTEKASAEMQERVDKLVNVGYTDLQISTFHAFCQKLLEDYGLDIGLPNRFRVLTENEAWLLVQENLFEKFDLDYYRPLGNPGKYIEEMIDHFGKCKDELISPAEYLAYAESVKLDTDDVHTEEKSRLIEIANAYHSYQQLLLDNGCLDFADLIYYAHKLLTDRPAIRAALQKQYRYILVDEFQDVNYAQYELVKMLAGEGVTHACPPLAEPQGMRSTMATGEKEMRNEKREKSSHLTVVGDDDQSIYAFRGASVANILRFKEDYPSAKEIVLTDNYRSLQEILDRAYECIKHNNPDRLEAKLGIDKRLMAHDANSVANPVVHLHHKTGEDEVRAVISEINKLKEFDPTVSWNDFAILVRANAHAEPFLEALERAGIPYEFLTSAGLYRQRIVVDCFNILRTLDNYNDSHAVYGVLRLPCWQMNEHDMVQILHMARKKSEPLYYALKRAREFRLSEAGIAIAEQIVSLIDSSVKHTREEKPTTALLRFLQESGYLGYLTNQEEKGSTDVVRDVGHLRQFFEFIERYQRAVAVATLHRFISYYESVLASGDKGSLYQPADTPESVNVMTAHTAKGLEFRYVFVVNCVEQRFPGIHRRDGIEIPIALVRQQLPEGDYHEEEERRLFYVAMTRAKERLYVTSAEYYEGNKRAKKPSRFLKEIGLDVTSTDSKKEMVPTAVGISPAGSRNGMWKAGSGRFVYELPTTFSYSQIRAFLTCPYQYKLAYLLGLPVQQSHYLSFGNAIHLTLQQFYERVREMNKSAQGNLFEIEVEIGKGPDCDRDLAPPRRGLEKREMGGVKTPTLDELLKLYDANWSDDWYESKRQREEYFARGRETLKKFYEVNMDSWTIPAELEKKFTLVLGAYHITGRIDRVDQLAGKTLHIIDYKTGGAKETVSGDDKDQLLLYQLAAVHTERLRSLGPPAKLTYYYLVDNIQTSFLGSDKELQKFEQKMIEAMDKIHATDFSKINRADACGRCEFCRVSEYRR